MCSFPKLRGNYMHEWFKKFLFAKELQFNEGEIMLLGNRVVMVPASTLKVMSEQTIKDPQFGVQLYEENKKALRDGWCKEVKKKYKLTGIKLVEWTINVGKIAGWGVTTLDNCDMDKKMGIGHNLNSPIALLFKSNPSPVPIDHIYRGMVAGAWSAAFEDDVDAVEKECIATGAPQCTYIIKRREEFMKEKDKPLVRRQLLGENV